MEVLHSNDRAVFFCFHGIICVGIPTISKTLVFDLLWRTRCWVHHTETEMKVKYVAAWKSGWGVILNLSVLSPVSLPINPTPLNPLHGWIKVRPSPEGSAVAALFALLSTCWYDLGSWCDVRYQKSVSTCHQLFGHISRGGPEPSVFRLASLPLPIQGPAEGSSGDAWRWRTQNMTKLFPSHFCFTCYSCYFFHLLWVLLIFFSMGIAHILLYTVVCKMCVCPWPVMTKNMYVCKWVSFVVLSSHWKWYLRIGESVDAP